jgi:hypothetical protein
LDVLRKTGDPEEPARYHPNLSTADIERMEMDCVAGQKPEDRGQEIIKKRKPNKRVYWKHIGRVIGASKGEQTEYIFVEYGISGNVHGRPMTVRELRGKGAEL